MNMKPQPSPTPLAPRWGASVSRAWSGGVRSLRSLDPRLISFSPSGWEPCVRAALVALAFVLAGMLAIPTIASAQTANLYTKPVPGAAGGISGRVNTELTHAVALHRDRVSCYRAEISDGGQAFRFSGLPTGKYDLVFITKSGGIYEGLFLGESRDSMTGIMRQKLDERVLKADTFFNKARLHRFGVTEDGNLCLAFVERVRDTLILKQSGETLNSNLRRFEIIDLAKATDNWQMMTSRHIYREEAPVGEGMGFNDHRHLPGLGNLRVIDTVKDLGNIVLPPAK